MLKAWMVSFLYSKFESIYMGKKDKLTIVLMNSLTLILPFLMRWKLMLKLTKVQV